MVSERFLHTRTHHIILFLLAILFTATGFFFARSTYAMAALFCISGLLCCWFFFKLYRLTNEAVTYFFHALQNDDTSLLFPEAVKNKSLARLYESMNRLNRHYQEIKLQNEYNERYYILQLTLSKYLRTSSLYASLLILVLK